MTSDSRGAEGSRSRREGHLHEARDGRSPFPFDSMVLTLLLILVAIIATFLVWFRGIEVPHCESRCDFTLLFWAGTGYAIFSAAVVLSSIGLVILGWLRSCRTLWIPFSGAAALVVGALIANTVASHALRY